MLTLRPYQQNLFEDIRKAYIDAFKAPLVVLPTGGGKTVIFAHVAASVAARGKRVMVLVHRVELLRQTSEALHKSAVDHALVNPKFTPDYRKKVQVASVQTLVNRLSKMTAPDLIIIDEAHHATAGTWRKIVEAFPNARILGVTATPCRGDGTGLGVNAGGLFDILLEGPTVQWLIDNGFLVKPVVYAPKDKLDLSGVKIVRGDYDTKEITSRVDKPRITGNAVAHYSKLCPGEPAVVFCVSVIHAQHVADEFRAAGYSSYAVDGSMEDDIRKRILNGLGNGTVQVVTSCDLISEGTDIPAIACAILLRPTASLGLYIQQVGRALRPSKGKDRAIILDHVGNVITHGLPEEPREWTLDGEPKKTRKTLTEKAITVKQCMQCFAFQEPGPTCPHCGFVHPIESKELQEVEGELQEITPAQAMAMKKQRIVEVARAKTLEELQAIGRARGYKPGWATHMMQHREKKAQG
jgi:superfamily II DNA or RNA helicase